MKTTKNLLIITDKVSMAGVFVSSLFLFLLPFIKVPVSSVGFTLTCIILAILNFNYLIRGK